MGQLPRTLPSQVRLCPWSSLIPLVTHQFLITPILNPKTHNHCSVNLMHHNKMKKLLSDRLLNTELNLKTYGNRNFQNKTSFIILTFEFRKKTKLRFFFQNFRSSPTLILVTIPENFKYKDNQNTELFCVQVPFPSPMFLS